MASAKYYGTGRRKKSIARVYLVPGTGKVTINKRDIDEYFGLETLKVIVRQPLAATETADKFDVIVNVHGGGYTGQAGAIRHGVARALLTVDNDYRPVLKKAGFLTRDPRMKKTYKIDVDCANCANKMEEAAKNTAGVKDATVNFMMLKMIVEFEDGQNPKSVMQDVLKNCKKVEDDCEIFL